jgi:predicted kinase
VARAIEEECAGCDPRNFGAFLRAARAALIEAHQPTEAMIRLGAFVTGDADIARECWRAMIQAALGKD